MIRRLLLPLLLLLLIAGAGQTYASVEIEASATPFETSAEVSEEDEAEEECAEGADEGFEEGAEGGEECEAEESGPFSPGECLLRTAHARVVAYPTRNQIRLTLGYTTYAPAQATVEYRVKNDDRLGAVSRALGRSGVVRVSKHLGDGEMARLQTSHHFTVTVHVRDVPQRCESLETQRLAVQHSSDSRVTWSQSG
jgi:hypothetical protein